MMPNSYPRQKPGFFIEEMDTECLLYRLGTHKAIHLNHSASVIWKLCDGTRTVADIIDLLQGQYPPDTVSIASDVREAIAILVREGAIAEAAAP
jgi:hypothetical protein